MDSAGLVVSERHRDYRISACCPCRPEPDIVGSWCNLGEEVYVHHVGLQRMRRVQDSADTCLDVEETAVDAFEQKMIPAILAPFFVWPAVLDTFCPMCQNGIRDACVQFEQVFQHVLVIVHVVIHRDDYGIGEVEQRRNQLAVGADIAVVVTYFEYRIVFCKGKESLGHFTFCKLRHCNI